MSTTYIRYPFLNLLQPDGIVTPNDDVRDYLTISASSYISFDDRVVSRIAIETNITRIR